MSGSVTPTRRPREEDEGEIEDFEPSVDGQSSPRSSTHKRPRLSYANEIEEEDEEDGDDEEQDANIGNGALLPDSYRRSPEGKGRAIDMLRNGQHPQEHKPGSIVRVTLVDFVTYTRAEFHPGPNLNMIIGPNGTGKSTLVCAICLGLGWSTQHLGRAKDLGEFVKHGAKRAEIVIELARDPEEQDENPVIATRITKDGNKAEYLLNGKKSNKKGVQQLARSFSIQVDNLCQFLPQDRVVEFAALSPEDLLVQTQRAAAPEYMSQWHSDLKEMRKAQRTKQDEQQALLESMKHDENRQRLQEADVTRLREREELQERRTILERLRPFPQYAVAKEKHAAAKARKKEAERELRRLREGAAPSLQAAQDKQGYLERIEKVAASRQRLVARQEALVMENRKQITNSEEQIEVCVKDIQTEKQSNSKNRQQADRLRTELANLQKAMQTPPEPFDTAEMNDRIRDRTRRVRELEARGRDIGMEIKSIDQQGQQRTRMLEQCRKDKESLLSQAGQQTSKLAKASRDAATAWTWIQNNRDRFEREVFGPPIIECTLKNPAHASALESIIPEGEKLAFTVTCDNDFRMLSRQLHDDLNLTQINIRNSPNALSSFRSPMSQEDLQRHGFDCYILDMLEGPEAVLAMLCDNARIQQTAYTGRDITSAQFDALQHTALSTWVTSKSTYQIVRRREYGDQAMQTRVNPLKEARYFTDAPVDRQQEQEIEAREREAKGERAELGHEKQKLLAELKERGVERDQLKEEQEALQTEKDEKQRQQSAFNGLPVKEERVKEQLKVKEEALQGTRERIKQIVDRGDTMTVEMGQLALDYSNSVEALRGLHTSLFEVQILQIEAKSDLDQLEAKHAEETRMLFEREAEVAELTNVQAEALREGQRLRDVCTAIGSDLTDVDHEVYVEVVDNGKWTTDQLETEIQSVQARLDMTHGGGNQNTLREYNERATKIETKRAKLGDLEETLKDLFERIEQLRLRWEPELDGLVAQISEAFAENFARIQCAGEVAVYKDDDFEQWAIQIKVKFREMEQLSVLDSHRQSGGERAVSTIFYLMALQSLARAPFRVVDEINQGMDPRNERLVHSRMVDIACAEHTSQYFLITPKLLSGLKYHPNMKVHCIASGEYMPSDHRELDFGALAKRALAIREAGPDVEVAG